MYTNLGHLEWDMGQKEITNGRVSEEVPTGEENWERSLRTRRETQLVEWTRENVTLCDICLCWISEYMVGRQKIICCSGMTFQQSKERCWISLAKWTSYISSAHVFLCKRLYISADSILSWNDVSSTCPVGQNPRRYLKRPTLTISFVRWHDCHHGMYKWLMSVSKSLQWCISSNNKMANDRRKMIAMSMINL